MQNDFVMVFQFSENVLKTKTLNNRLERGKTFSSGDTLKESSSTPFTLTKFSSYHTSIVELLPRVNQPVAERLVFATQ